MNQRAIELYREACEFAYKICKEHGGAGGPSDHVWQTVSTGRFAELIVEECTNALHDMHLWQTVNLQNYPSAWHEAVDDGIATIKQHFGVQQ